VKSSWLTSFGWIVRVSFGKLNRSGAVGLGLDNVGSLVTKLFFFFGFFFALLDDFLASFFSANAKRLMDDSILHQHTLLKISG
jgi:hypothetical protein